MTTDPTTALLAPVPVTFQTLIATELAGIHHDLHLVRALVDTRQAGLGFLSVEAAQVQDDLIRSERRDRQRHAREGITPTGVVPAPGSVNAFSLLAEWRTFLADIEHTITTRLIRGGVCHLTARPDDTPDEHDARRYTRVVDLIAITTRPALLARIHRDALDLHDRVRRCIDGTQVKAMPDPCPWCGRHTLVADLIAGEIRCGRDPDTSEYEPCLCSDSYCGCRFRRVRHTWHRDHRAHKTTSWQGLRRAINAKESDA